MCASWDRMRFVPRVALWRTFHSSVSVVAVLFALGLDPEGVFALWALPTRSMVKNYGEALHLALSLSYIKISLKI